MNGCERGYSLLYKTNPVRLHHGYSGLKLPRRYTPAYVEAPCKESDDFGIDVVQFLAKGI